ncbi:MAG: hypothetical protein MI723_09370 [Caulobacterales bacterium]|nr:hypothetical protein [Caulobacterales bacterium]
MKLLVSLLAAIALLNASPALCPHALNAGAGVSAPETHASHAAHHAGHQEHAPSPHADHGCAEDCDGGADCSGCALGSVAVLADVARSIDRPLPIRALTPDGDRRGAGPGLDTPPPRA